MGPRVYIGGPMTKEKDKGTAAFVYAWNRLKKAGYYPVSPHHLENAIDIETRAKLSKEEVYRYALPIDIFALSSCDVMIVLPRYYDSDGTGFEQHGAKLMGIKVVDGYGPLPWQYASELTLEQYMDRVLIYLQTEADLCPTTPS
jgi:hypothetical protein